jgi:hypothetical protein
MHLLTSEEQKGLGEALRIDVLTSESDQMKTQTCKDKRNVDGIKLVSNRRGGKLLKPEKGERPGGRQKGTRNLFTREIKKALIEAANIAGDKLTAKNYSGEAIKMFPGLITLQNHGGMIGYFMHLALFHPQKFLWLLNKAMPIHVPSQEEEGAEHVQDIQGRSRKS